MNDPEREMPRIEYHRVAPRYQVNLKGSILILAIGNQAEADNPYFTLQGQLQNVSVSGLAIIISFKDMVHLKMLGENIMLRLLLPLPVQAIELDVTPVRYQTLMEGEDRNVLVGAQITDMNGRDRIIFMEFIRGFEIGYNAVQ